MNKKQIAVITPSKFPGTGGDTASFSEMINQLIIEGFGVSLICPKSTDSNDKNLSISNEVEITRIPYVPPRLKEIKSDIKPKYYLQLLLFLLIESLTVLWILTHKRIKYVIVRHAVLTMQLPIIFKLLGVRVVADGTELISEGFKNKISPRILSLVKNYERKVIKLYTYYKVITYIQGENLQRFGFPKERILIIPHGVNIDKIPKFPIEEIPEHTFGYFGVLERWQGVDILLKGFKLLIEKIPSATLYIIGEGSLEDELKKIVSQNNLSSNVIFTSVSREVLWHEYFRKFRIVVIPRPKQNNAMDTLLSIKMVECFAAGKPMIAIDIPVMKELPKNSVFVVQSEDPKSLANAMETLTMSNENMKKYADAALTLSANYDIRDTIKKLVNALVDD